MKLSIKTKVFVLCLFLTLLCVMGISTTFYIFTTRSTYRQSQERIQVAFDIILNDIYHQKHTYPNRFNDFLKQDTLRRTLFNYQQDKRQIGSSLFITGHLVRVLNELQRFGDLVAINKLLLYAEDGRLIAIYKHVNGEEEMGVFALSENNRDSYLSLTDRALQAQILYGSQGIPDAPLPEDVDAHYEGELPTSSYTEMFAKQGSVGLRIYAPVNYLNGRVGLLVGEVVYTQEMLEHFSAITKTEVNLFSGTQFSVGTLRSHQKLSEELFNTMHIADDVFKGAEKIPILSTHFDGHSYFQGTCGLTQANNVIGALSISLSQKIQEQENRRFLVSVLTVAALVLLIAFALTAIFTRRTIGFIHDLIKSTSVIASGDLTQEIQGQSNDELGILAHSFTAMRDSVKDKINDLERLTTILQSTSDFIAMYTTDKKIQFINAAGRAMLGWSTDENLALRSIDEVYPTWAIRKIEEIALSIVQEKGIWSGETAIRGKNGEEIPVSQVIMYHRGQDGQLDYISTIMRDLTDRKKGEQALRASEENLRITLESIGDGVIAADSTGHITRMNAVAERLTGWSLEEALGMTLTEVLKIVDESSIHHSENYMVAAQQNQTGYAVLKSRNGGERVIAKSGAPIRNDSDEIVGVVMVFRDITAHRKLEEQLRQSEKLKVVGQLAGGVAHDFNNMLGVILGRVELILGDLEKNSSLYDNLKIIQTAAERSAALTRQLLTFARKQIIAPRQLDLNDTVESMLKMLRRLIGEDIDLIWKPAVPLGPVNMDPSQIDQILINLCVNARDAIAGVGRLTIETDRQTFDDTYCRDHAGVIPGDFVLLAVSDTGCGMDKKTLDNLFEPFFTTKGVGQGTGLGLATVYGIVTQNKGFINVYSEPGLGTTFKIYLPLQTTDEDTATGIPAMKKSTGGDETILLVEDEPMVLDLTTTMLQVLGYTVLVAHEPGEAISLAEEHPGHIDLLMTDVVMPGMNGRDLARKITSLFPGIKLLFMSGYTADIIAHQGVLDEGVAFIQKPFSMADMAVKLRGALKS